MSVKIKIYDGTPGGRIAKYPTSCRILVDSTDKNGDYCANPDTFGDTDSESVDDAIRAARVSSFDSNLGMVIGPLIVAALILISYGGVGVIIVVLVALLITRGEKEFKKKRSITLAELEEFKDYWTINGYEARRVFGRDPRNFIVWIYIFLFPISWFIWCVMGLRDLLYYGCLIGCLFLLEMANNHHQANGTYIEPDVLPDEYYDAVARRKYRKRTQSETQPAGNKSEPSSVHAATPKEYRKNPTAGNKSGPSRARATTSKGYKKKQTEADLRRLLPKNYPKSRPVTTEAVNEWYEKRRAAAKKRKARPKADR